MISFCNFKKQGKAMPYRIGGKNETKCTYKGNRDLYSCKRNK